MTQAGETGETDESAATRRGSKRASAFRTIGEVAEELDLPAHVLRFWESKFPQLRPLKRGGGRRYYRPEDIVLLRRIRQCLYQDGYTIRGVQKLLRDGAPEPDAPDAIAEADGGGEVTLFPLAAEPEIEPKHLLAKAPRPAAKHELSPADRTALEEVRRDLLEIRALLDPLMRRG